MLKKTYFMIFCTVTIVSVFLSLIYLRNERVKNKLVCFSERMSKYRVNTAGLAPKKGSGLALRPDTLYLYCETRKVGIKPRDDGSIDGNIAMVNQPIISWQQITTTIMESKQKIVFNIIVPKIIISSNYNLGDEINKLIMRRVELLKDNFVSGVSTTAEDNGEANTLTINTETLLTTPRLISLVFTTTKHMTGVRDSAPGRTFLAFDLTKGILMREGNEVFNDDNAWAKAVTKMKSTLLTQYSGRPNCDFMFAPQPNGFAASCIGVDFEKGVTPIAIAGDIPIAMVKEFVKSSVLLDILSVSDDFREI